MRGSRALTVLVLAAAAVGQTAQQEQTYQKRRLKAVSAAYKRHYELGKRCRNLGLNAQATAQFLRSQEVAEGLIPHADAVVRVMRSFGPAFWKGERKRPSKRVLRGYEKDARKLEEATRKERFKLAKYAAKLGLRDEAHRLYTLLLRESLESEKKKDGSIEVDGGTIPKEFAAPFIDDEVKINDRVRPRDRFLADLGKVLGDGELFEVTDDVLRVRTEVGQQGGAERV